MVVIYPKTIKHTTSDKVLNQTCCNGRGYGTQKLYNDGNLKTVTSYASWGEDTVNASGPSGNSAKAIATPSGTRRQPEEIILTNWNTSSIPSGSKITSVEVQVKYHTAGYKNYSYVAGYFPDKTILTLNNSKGKKLSAGSIQGPTANDKEYSTTFSSLNLTPSDLNNCQLSIKIGENKRDGVVCKVKVQYIRLKVTYTNPTPKYKLTASVPSTQRFNQPFTYSCTVNSTNNYSDSTTFYIQIPKDITITNFNGLKYHKDNGSFFTYKKSLDKAKNHTVSFTAKSNNPGKKTFYAYLSKYGSNNVTSTTEIVKPTIKFNVSLATADATTSDTIPDNSSFISEVNKTIDFYEGKKYVQIVATLDRSLNKLPNVQEEVEVETNDLSIEWQPSTQYTVNGNKITFNANQVTLRSEPLLLTDAKVYLVTLKYTDIETQTFNNQTCIIQVKSVPLTKNFFKIRLEDGSDVQYNSLSFSRGDDLVHPLTYDTSDITPVKPQDLYIRGETKRIPTEEAEYTTFNIDLNIETEKEYVLENVVAHIDATNSKGEDCSNIILGVDDNGTLLSSNDKKYCLIKKISNQASNQLRIAVMSDEVQDCVIKLRPYNYDLYDTEWVPSKISFSEIPNIKLTIDSDSNDISSGDIIDIHYYIENKSDTDGTNLKFQLIEPPSFNVVNDLPPILDEYVDEDETVHTKVSFNAQNRIITFKKLEANSKRYIFTISYKATKKGVHNFMLNTINSQYNITDDQNKNSYKYPVLVDVVSDVHIKTFVSNSQPYTDDLIDFTIFMENRFKSQNNFIFSISDYGDYSSPLGHNTSEMFDGKDYTVEYVDCDYGDFEINEEENNKIGTWNLTNVPADKQYKLVLTLRAKKEGMHIIHTEFENIRNSSEPQDNIQRFDNKVKILQAKKRLSFDVYQAMCDKDIECPTFDDLIRICDEDYISLTDSIYYVIEVKNNSAMELAQDINVYGRLPKSFIENDITCYSPSKPIKNANNNLLNISTNKIEGCGTFRAFFKVTPTQEGKFVINFMLATKTADVYTKQLHLTVDSEFNQRELEHEIIIYNFEKTNRNYRYEIDNNGEIFKFFNKGDRTVRPIETEDYNVNAIERYKGNNLKKIVEDIKENSRYVDPVFLRIGSNKLADRGYELYPDGFIRRFGLLKSEIFHHAHQLPVIDNLSRYAFRWDIDEWNTKVWAGAPYDNGYFDLTIDYSKIPSNFNLLDIDEPINKLQNIVNKTKPYGTQGICYYSATSKLHFAIDIDAVATTISNSVDLAIKCADMYLITTFNRHDNSLVMFYDDIDVDFKINYDRKSFFYEYFSNNGLEEEDDLRKRITTAVDSICIYDDIDERFYIEDCMDVLRNLYSKNNNTQGIDVTFPYRRFISTEENSRYLSDYQFLNCINNCTDNEFIGYEITYKDTTTKFGYKREDINNFEGFVLEVDGEEVNRRNNNEQATKFSVGVYKTYQDGVITVHFWGSINEKEYYHIGFIEFADTKVSEEVTRSGRLRNGGLRGSTSKNFFVMYNDVIIDENSVCRPTYSSYKTDNDKSIPITFKITDQVKEKTFTPTVIKEVGSKKWNYLDNINKGNKHAIFTYNSKIDKECDDKTDKVPRLAFKCSPNVSRQHEIVDIDFTVKAKSNKEGFADDINVNVYKDGDYYYPVEESRKIYYPNSVSNTTKDLATTYVIHQPNITICSTCLKTSLGYYDKCPHCDSKDVSHMHKTEPVTVCDSCGWIAQGTHNYCKHCLSLDVTNVDVDYNKTYCNECKKISDDYYGHCPLCFSADIIYLDNKQQAYRLSKGKQNIDPITIQTSEREVNVFNMKVPFNAETEELNEIESLVLNIECTNNNDGKYYYCPECGTGGLGEKSECPKCHNKVINKNVLNNDFNTYIRIDGRLQKLDLMENGSVNNAISNGSFVKTIDLMELAKKINTTSFDIQLYINNPHVQVNTKNILDLPIEDEYLDEILSKINDFDFRIDNLFVDCIFKKNNNWLNLDSLNGESHSGLKYEVLPYEISTEPLEIFDFDIPPYEYDNASLYIAGICKNKAPYGMYIEITNGNDTLLTKNITNITDVLFNYEIDLDDISTSNLEHLNVEIIFNDINKTKEITITDCNILMTKSNKTLKDITMKQESIQCINKGNNYLIKSDNLWGLNTTEPYYLSGRQLETSLLCYIDFGSIHSSEYIRLYDIYMTIYYKTKTGQITTDTIEVLNDRNTEQYISGQLVKNNGEFWGSIKDTQESLNNLEYQNLNIDEKGNLSNSIPLRTTISQSFTYLYDNISQIELAYFGKKGYPSDIITVYLYDDYDNKPNNLIGQNKIIMPTVKGIINVDFDVNVNPNKKYWIVIEDVNADNNNYHRFNYSQESVGTLMYEAKTTDKQSLCFTLYSANEIQSYYDLPTEWTITPINNYNDETDTDAQATTYTSVDNNEKNNNASMEYKMTNMFYRYNTKDSSNISLSNMIIKNGYYYQDEVE